MIETDTVVLNSIDNTPRPYCLPGTGNSVGDDDDDDDDDFGYDFGLVNCPTEVGYFIICIYNYVNPKWNPNCSMVNCSIMGWEMSYNP